MVLMALVCAAAAGIALYVTACLSSVQLYLLHDLPSVHRSL